MPNTDHAEHRIDALLPAEIAEKAEEIGVHKARLDVLSLVALAVLAGAFIALGSMFATTVLAGADGVIPFGVSRLLAGIVFGLGLILVVLGGAELFTGNNLMVMAWAAGKLPLRDMLRAWTIVYIGNFIGAFGTALLVFLSGQYLVGHGAVAAVALKIASDKSALPFDHALFQIGKFHGRVRPRAAGVPVRPVSRRARRGRRSRAQDRVRQDRPALRPCAVSRRVVQRAGLLGGVAVVRRPHHDRQGARRAVPGIGFRRRRLRAFGRQYVFHPARPVHEGLGAGRNVVADRKQRRRLCRPDLAGIFPQPDPGHHRQYHRRRRAGRRRLLVHLFAQTLTAVRYFAHSASSVSSVAPMSLPTLELASMSCTPSIKATYSGPSFADISSICFDRASTFLVSFFWSACSTCSPSLAMSQ